MERKDQETPPSGPPEPPNRQTAVLNEIKLLTADLIHLRRKQFLISALGVLVILGILVTFLLNLVSFTQAFDHRLLSAELIGKAGTLAKTTGVQDIENDFREVFLPAYRRELSVEMDNRMPAIGKSIAEENKSLLNYIRDDLRLKIQNDLQKEFTVLEGELVAKYGNKAPSKEELAAGLVETRNTIFADLSGSLDGKLDKATAALAELNDTCRSFQTLPEYKAASKLTASDAERHLVTSFLELWIYHLDPERGSKKADVKGGI